MYTSEEAEEVECAICMNALVEDTAVTFRVCRHVFCDKCIENFFLRKLDKCPLCRAQVDRG